MAIQSLTPPQDITWTRMAFSRDMIDTNFTDFKFGPKWRSSLAVSFYVVPEEETADAYPNSRIVYLKMSASITGWNPSEDLLEVKKAAEEAGTWDDLQRTLWDVIVASGWASTYWACLGAIMQIAVYPNNPTGVAVDDYPYIMDFEPKKREIFEQVTEGGEFLSGSAESLSITKGVTTTKSVDVSAGGSFLGIGASASAGVSQERVDTSTTDTSRESRETSSHSTSFSQMYQLFNGYHLGTNRALFVIAPRPHTVSAGDQVDFNLINGERKLEGLQDVFLVVHLPRSLDGFCIQAGLDTGHKATITTPRYLAAQKNDDFDPQNPTPPPPPPPPPPDTPVEQLVITRRIMQACGTFDDNGNFDLRQVREPRRRPQVVGEIAVDALPTRALFRSATGESGRSTRVAAANNLNRLQSEINRRMLDSASAASYEPRDFTESNVFRSLVATSASRADIPLAELADRGYIDRDTLEFLGRHRITTLRDLFGTATVGGDVADEDSAKRRIIDRLLKGTYR